MGDAFAPPAWWPPYDPTRPVPSRGPLVVGLEISLTTLSLFAVCGRFYSRSRITKSLKSDDWTILAALVILIIKTAFVCLLIETVGYGKHIYDVTPEEYMAYGRTSTVFANNFIGIGSISTSFFVRTSVLLFLGHINPYVWMRNCVWAGLAMNTTHYLISLCSIVFRCGNPSFSFSFGPVPPGVTCIDSTPWNTALNIIAIILDFYCWSLPVWLVWRVPVSIKIRLQLIGLLCIGLIACVGAIARIWPSLVLYDPTSDVSWIVADIYISSNIEMSIGLIAACIPGNKPLFDVLSRTVHGWFFAMSSQGSNSSKDHAHLNETQMPVSNIALATIDRQDLEAQRNLEWDSSMVSVTIDGQQYSEGKNSPKMIGRIGRLDAF